MASFGASVSEVAPKIEWELKANADEGGSGNTESDDEYAEHDSDLDELAVKDLNVKKSQSEIMKEKKEKSNQIGADDESGVWIKKGGTITREHTLKKSGFYRLELSLPLKQMQRSKVFQMFKAHKWARTFGGESRYTVAVNVTVANEYQTVLRKELKLSLPINLEEALKAEEDDDSPLTAHHTSINFEVPHGFVPCKVHISFQSYSLLKSLHLQAVLFQTGHKSVSNLGQIGRELFKHGMNRDVRTIVKQNAELLEASKTQSMLDLLKDPVDATFYHLKNSTPPVLPLSCQSGNWVEIFSTARFGANFTKFIENADEHRYGKQLLIVKTTQDEIIGGFSSDYGFGTTRPAGSYGGNGECFVFHYDPRIAKQNLGSGFKAYKWTHKNNMFRFTTPVRGLGMGGAKWALYLSNHLDIGTSEPCDTYGNSEPIIVSPFQCAEVLLFVYESISKS